MAEDRDTLELLRLWRSFDRPTRRALLTCARLLQHNPTWGDPDDEPHRFTYRQHFIQLMDLLSELLRRPRSPDQP